MWILLKEIDFWGYASLLLQLDCLKIFGRYLLTMASSKISREKLKRNGSFQKKEPPPPPPDEHLFPDVKLEDFEMLKTIGKLGIY